MAILIVAIVLGVAPVLAATVLAAARLAFTRPGRVRRLSRIDLRGMFIITFGLAVTLALTRYLLSSDEAMNTLYAVCFLPMLLPISGWRGMRLKMSGRRPQARTSSRIPTRTCRS